MSLDETIRDIAECPAAPYVGQLFLLNLVESLELELVRRDSVRDYFQGLDKILKPNRRKAGWWLGPVYALQLQQVATVSSSQAGNREYVSFRFHKLNSLPAPFRPAPNDPPKPLTLSDGLDVLLPILFSRVRGWYWFTCQTYIDKTRSLADLRNKLGLDWLEGDHACYEVKFTHDQVVAWGGATFRPSGLCAGSARFKVRRLDEDRHDTYENWGMAVDLSEWTARQCAAHGAPETLIALPEDVIATMSELTFRGTVLNMQPVKDDDVFAEMLNQGPIEVNELLQRFRKALD